MSAASRMSYRPLTDVPEEPPAAPDTVIPITRLGLATPKHSWPQAPHIFPNESVDYHHGLPDLQRQYFGQPQGYASSYLEPQYPRIFPFSVAQSSLSGCHSPSCSGLLPSLSSSHLPSGNPIQRWQSFESFHPPTPVFDLPTPVRLPCCVSTP